jgi:anti-anti-sigma factor
MQVKIDTKEKFTVVTPTEPVLSANIAAELTEHCRAQLLNPVKNVILNLASVSSTDETAAEALTVLQQYFYEHNASFVICCMTEPVEQILEKAEMLDLLNITPTESEAWDIVQMEEIERELLDGDDINFDSHD